MNLRAVARWVRDSSLVFKTIIDQYTLGLDDSYRDLIDAFVAAEGQLQQLTNPSGSVSITIFLCLLPPDSTIIRFRQVASENRSFTLT